MEEISEQLSKGSIVFPDRSEKIDSGKNYQWPPFLNLQQHMSL